MSSMCFTADRFVEPAMLRGWAARLTGCSLEAVVCREILQSRPPGAVVVLHEHYDNTSFEHGYEVYAPPFERAHLPGVPQQVAALVELAGESGSWILADTDDHAQGRVLLITEAGVWCSNFDPTLDDDAGIMRHDRETARQAALATRINRPLGWLFMPDGVSQEVIELVVVERLGVSRRELVSLELSSGALPTGPGYDRELIETHLRRPYEVSYADLRPWRPVGEELTAWIDAVQAASRAIRSPLYTTHGTFNVVMNIPGGSDSQAHCLRLDGRTVEELVYKRCRASW